MVISKQLNLMQSMHLHLDISVSSLAVNLHVVGIFLDLTKAYDVIKPQHPALQTRVLWGQRYYKFMVQILFI